MFRRLKRTIKRAVLGKPLATSSAAEERLNNFQALAIFGSDALSSTAYATEEILLVLIAGGLALLSLSFPIALAISMLIFIVALSYREIVHAYPHGGGVYSVAKENLGETAGLLGASSLMIDYILTVAVSVAAGVAAITSAFPFLFPYRVIFGIIVILFLMVLNLRGVRSSGKILFFPTYVFIFLMLALIGFGVFKFFNGALQPIPMQSNLVGPIEAFGIFLLLKAFASGCTALTGIEAISNGVKVFRPPESRNAAKTLFKLASLLALIFLGVTFLAIQVNAVPNVHETIISQVAKAVLGETPLYILVQFATFLILFLAANTPYVDFPRVLAIQAKDGYWPKQFSAIGSRLIFPNGIIALSLISGLLLYLFSGSVHSLIPLYAVGVFLGFSLSQLGMILHWKKKGIRKHKKNTIINIIGFFTTLIVFLVVFSAKFLAGAWILLPTVGLMILMMKIIKDHYVKVEKALEIEKAPIFELPSKKITMVVLVSEINRLSIETAIFARGFHPGILRAFHVAFDEAEGEKMKQEWEKRFPDIPMEIAVNEYRNIIPPVLKFFKELEEQRAKRPSEGFGTIIKLLKGHKEPQADGKIVAVIPMVVPKQHWAEFLHNNTARKIADAIRADPGNDVEILENYVKVP